MKSQRDKRNYIIIGLCMILVVMGVGYAAFSQLLTINGTANISNSWCVGFDNTKENDYTAKAGITGGTTPTGTITFSGSTCEAKYQPDASLTATFKQPGDQIEYTLTIKNKSTVPVAIKSIQVENNSVTTDTTIKKGNIDFIVHMPETTNLAVDGETTMKVVARFQNTTDVTGPYDGEEQTLNVKINAEQGTGTDGMTTTYTGTVYRHNENYVTVGDNINDTESVWVIATSSGTQMSGGKYDSEEECQTTCNQMKSFFPNQGLNCQTREKGLGNYTEDADSLNKIYYLKHDIVEDVVTASYVCFVYNNKEHCMQGGTSSSYSSNQQLLKDYQNYYNLSSYDSSTNYGCKYNTSSSSCGGENISRIEILSSGAVNVYENDSAIFRCLVGNNNGSYCTE